MGPEADFRRALLDRVLRGTGEHVTGAGDRPWSVAVAWSESPRSRARDVATRAGARRTRFDPALAAERLDELLGEAAGFARTWELLADDAQRALLLDLLAFRVLGAFHVALPVSPRRFQAVWARMRAAVQPGPSVRSPTGAELPLLEYRGIRLHADPFQLVAFELGQYRDAAPGETVVDGGAGFGETALVYARQVGPGGRVVAVELDDGNLELIERNLALNPELAVRIAVHRGGLWERPGEELAYTARGGESAVGSGAARSPSLTVDALGLERVDRIKLDVEGAEPYALRGAAGVLERDAPALEVAAYHSPADLARLPELIAGIQPRYRLTLGHFTPAEPETILRAEA